MRFMIIVKANPSTEAGVMPGEKLMMDMAQYHEALQKAGVLVEGSGLKPSSHGFRIRYRGAQRSVVDGPFAEAKELIAGFTVINVKSRDEAVDWAKRFPNPHGEGVDTEIEVRPFYEIEDFAPNDAVERFRKMEQDMNIRKH
jgi:hypothetical protein